MSLKPEARSKEPEAGSRKITISDLRFSISDLRCAIYGLLALAIVLGVLAFPALARAADDTPVSPQVQAEVDRGLEFLAKQQVKDGLNAGLFPSNIGQSTAVSSLAVMAFLSAGHVPGQGPYGEVVNKGVDAIMNSQKDTGLLSETSGNTPMYDHGISTVMLCEAYGMVDPARRVRIEKVVGKAVKLIVDAQRVRKNPNDQGGWRYRPNDPSSDISVTGWQLMALRGAANIGASVPEQTIKDGLAYIRRRATPSGGFSYTSNNGPNPARTGTGILSLELLGQHESAEALAGGDYLLQYQFARQRGAEHYSYTIYYCAQAANQLGGKYWDGIYKPIRDAVLATQRPDGSWLHGDDDNQGGPVYATSMSLLVLTVPFHYLPIYQK